MIGLVILHMTKKTI
uniref:Uncharacterized protein n=1 Tax=Arundo donax TaxID=35708 RepID=A0A0A8ZUE8_ARUDO